MPTTCRWLLAALCLTALASCSRPADPLKEAQAIREQAQKWNQAIGAKDSTAVAAYYLDDAIMHAPNMPPVSGRKAISSWWGSTLRFPNASLSFATSDVMVAQSGDLAYSRGTYRMSVEMPQGPISDSGKSLVLWKKSGNEWKVAVDMYSSDETLFAPPAQPQRR